VVPVRIIDVGFLRLARLNPALGGAQQFEPKLAFERSNDETFQVSLRAETATGVAYQPSSREDSILLSHLRSDHCPVISQYEQLISSALPSVLLSLGT
jgi:hypothetical protein